MKTRKRIPEYCRRDWRLRRQFFLMRGESRDGETPHLNYFIPHLIRSHPCLTKRFIRPCVICESDWRETSRHTFIETSKNGDKEHGKEKCLTCLVIPNLLPTSPSFLHIKKLCMPNRLLLSYTETQLLSYEGPPKVPATQLSKDNGSLRGIYPSRTIAGAKASSYPMTLFSNFDPKRKLLEHDLLCDQLSSL